MLLPLVNVPMISYTLEFLATNGVEEVFVFCSSHADKVETTATAPRPKPARLKKSRRLVGAAISGKG